MYDAGTAAMSVVPQFKGVETAVRKEATKWGLTAAQAFGKSFNSNIRKQAVEWGVTAGKAFSKSFNATVKQETAPTPVGPSKPRSQKQGVESGGSFADGFRQRVRAALRNLPPIEIGAAATEAEQKLRDLRVQLAALADKTVGVDVDAATAAAELAGIQRQLDELARTSPDVQVRADTAAAAGQLAAVARQVEALDGRKVDVDVDVDSGRAAASLASVGGAATASRGHVSALAVTGASLGPLIVPAAGAAAAAIAAIGPAALGAGAALGVGVLGFMGISDAVKALGGAQDDAGRSGASLAQRQYQIASAADSVRSAERALANARESNASSARRSAQQVADAERAVARAQAQAKQATLDLIRAREEERRANQDLAFDLEGTRLAQRRAALDVADAKANLDKVLADPKATEAQKEAARIAYEEIELRVRELAVQEQRLSREQKNTLKTGVEGSDRVRAAKDRIRQANEGVADAERRLADAIASQQDQQRQAAFALANAQQQVASAQRSLAQATTQTGESGSASMRKLRDAMDELSPAGRRFARFIFGLKDEFRVLRDSAAEGLLPGVQRSVQMLLPYLPQLSQFIGRVAETMGDLAVEGAKALTGPEWKSFFGFVSRTAVPALKDWSRITGNLVLGFGNLIAAFEPFSTDMQGGLLGLTRRFAEWSAGLSENQGFQSFLAYVRQYGPMVVSFFGDMMRIGGKLVVALAPLGALMLEGFGWLADLLAGLDPGVLLYIVAGIAGIVAILTTLAVGPVAAITAIVVMVVAMAGVIVYAYQRVGWFRTAVDTAFKAIASAALWLWRTVLQPAFTAWWGFANTMASIYTWLWRNVLEPAFKAIGAVAMWLWKNVFTPVFTAIRWWVSNVIGPLFRWLWRNVVQPAFKGIQVAVAVAWAIIKVVFGLVQIAAKAVGAIFRWLWREAIEPAWRGISTAISYVWDTKVKPVLRMFGNFVRDHVAPAFKKGVDAVSAAWEKIRDAAKIPVRFVVNTVINKAIIGTFNKIAAKFGVDKVEPVELPAGFHTGGVLPGYTPGQDVHLFHSPTAGALALSGGEGIIRPEGTRALGSDWIDGINRAARTGGVPAVERWLGGYADGGILDRLGKAASSGRRIVGDALSGLGDLFTDPAGVLRKIADKAIELTPGSGYFRNLLVGVPKKILDMLVDRVQSFFSGREGSGVSPGGLGWKRMMNILRAQFPGLRLISGFRPGAITATGNPSYHGVGRAVDLPPRMDVFEWIRRAFPNSRELIFSPANMRQVHNGRPHVYGGVTRRMHWDHVHWAYDQGGKLPPGVTQVYNGTGKPEAVLTAQQWQTMARLASHAEARAGNTYNFGFRDTTLTPARLRALQDREAALALADRQT